jgi:hypothetical protein
MTSLRILASLLVLAICTSCISLSHPRETDALSASNAESFSEDSLAEAEPALSWSDLTRLAREHRQRGELKEAAERLDQAALQVALLPPTHARRRTVFGLRSRLAIDLANSGDIESADQLTDTLLAEASAAPELGDAALISLALSAADRRSDIEQLPLLEIAFTTAQAGATSRERMDLGLRVAEQAYAQNDFPLARRGIDQAIVDAEHMGPSRRAKIASLEVFKSRIALAQNDLETAEQSATQANRLLDEISADPSDRGIAEATLSEALAKKGDVDKALVIARGAYARIGGVDPIEPHAQRVILVALARVNRSLGDTGSAKQHYEEALEIPGVDTPADTALVKRVSAELRELDNLDNLGTPTAAPPSPNEHPAF